VKTNKGILRQSSQWQKPSWAIPLGIIKDRKGKFIDDPKADNHDKHGGKTVKSLKEIYERSNDAN